MLSELEATEKVDKQGFSNLYSYSNQYARQKVSITKPDNRDERIDMNVSVLTQAGFDAYEVIPSPVR
jgi:hypothetical protein